MLQRAHSFDDQDRCLGMANVYVERDDQRNSMYGGIAHCELLSGRFRVLFDEQGAKAMHGVEEMEITFVASSERLLALRLALRRCFEGFSHYSENVA